MNKTPENKIKNACDSIVNFFPQYQNVMYKVFTTNQNLSNEINNIKKIIFDNILVVFYEESLEYIEYIIESIKQKYTSVYSLAIPDFIDLIYQNAFYDIFSAKFQELEIKQPDKITNEHLKIFNLIIYAEHIKYMLYEEYKNKTSSTNTTIMNTFEKRKNNSILRINVCMNLLKQYPRINDEYFDYVNIIDKYKIYNSKQDFENKFFKEII